MCFGHAHATEATAARSCWQRQQTHTRSPAEMSEHLELRWCLKTTSQEELDVRKAVGLTNGSESGASANLSGLDVRSQSAGLETKGRRASQVGRTSRQTSRRYRVGLVCVEVRLPHDSSPRALLETFAGVGLAALQTPRSEDPRCKAGSTFKEQKQCPPRCKPNRATAKLTAP